MASHVPAKRTRTGELTGEFTAQSTSTSWVSSFYGHPDRGEQLSVIDLLRWIDRTNAKWAGLISIYPYVSVFGAPEKHTIIEYETLDFKCTEVFEAPCCVKTIC